MNTKRRCRNCRGYFPAQEMVRVGSAFFCDKSCVESSWSKQFKKQRKKGSKSVIPQDVRFEVLTRDGRRCRMCGRTVGLHLHHVVYRSEGGKHVATNLLTLCYGCHDRVHSNKKLYQDLCSRMIEIAQSGDKSTLMKSFTEVSDAIGRVSRPSEVR